MSRIQVDPVCFFFFFYLFRISNIVCLSFLSASVRPHISSEQEDFIRRVTEIPLDKRKCWDLITLDTLHAYYGGSEPTQEACRLNAYSRWRKSPTLTLFFLSVDLSKAVTCLNNPLFAFL